MPTDKTDRDDAQVSPSQRAHEYAHSVDAMRDYKEFAVGGRRWNWSMDTRLRKYGSRAVRIWGYIGMGVLAIALMWLLGRIGNALQVLVAGAVMAFIYAPLVNMLDHRFHVPRLLGTFIGLFSLFAAIALLFLITIPPFTEQITALTRAFPGYVEQVQQVWSDIVDFAGSIDARTQGSVSNIIAQAGNQFQEAVGRIASTVGGGIFARITDVVGAVIDLFMAIVVSFWLAKDFPRIEREIATIVGPRVGEDYRLVTSVFGRSLGGYLRGLAITSTCTGTIAGVGFWILGIPYSGLLGFVTGVLNVIPYIGPWVGGALAFLVGTTVGLIPALLSIVVSFLAQQSTDLFVSPKVMQSAVALHPVLVIVALLGGGAVGGIPGMVFAVPLTAAGKGVFVYYFEKRSGRRLVTPEGALFKGEAFDDEDGNPRPACDALGVDIAGDKGVPPRILEARMEEERRMAAEMDAASGIGRKEAGATSRAEDNTEKPSS